MTSVFSWQNSVSLCPASFCTSRPNLPVILGISSYFCIPVPYNEKRSFGGVSSRRSCRSSQNRSTSASLAFGWGTDLDYCNIEWFALETNRDHSVVFEILLLKTIFKIILYQKLIIEIPSIRTVKSVSDYSHLISTIEMSIMIEQRYVNMKRCNF